MSIRQIYTYYAGSESVCTSHVSLTWLPSHLQQLLVSSLPAISDIQALFCFPAVPKRGVQ